ncbi:hypothetical protein ASPBRDRAFT_40227 [Aspergillus brasiliensis CBS 101740]|uniref:Uncharacterized protein n=1 Tax=Aspergillus brasiliensis (strain CBS 101740 / IMI 381727 / IBT 21946) TaxID=767769 RepID=A0A1L9UTB2_ASPBC|nr:hypothetical protein ASPBRDRAFT_40227 [Aspergillus brasiliensis CBS 101740]
MSIQIGGMDGPAVHSYDDGNVDSRISRDIDMDPSDGHMQTWSGFGMTVVTLIMAVLSPILLAI